MKTVKAEQITKEQFNQFIETRNMGVVNMNNVQEGARISNLPPEVYYTILLNFTGLRRKFSE